MGQSAEELRREIAETRDELGTTVDAIGDHVSPSRMIGRRKERLTNRWMSAKESVMGSASDMHSSVSSATDSVSHAPQSIASQAQGQPIVAGVIAFGLGFLAASVFPGTQTEAELAQKVQEVAQPAVDELQQSGQEAVAALKEPALDGVQHLKDSAQSGVDEIRDRAQGAAADAKETMADTKSSVSAQVQDSAKRVRDS